MKISGGFLAIVVAALALAVPAHAQQKKLVLATEAAFAPFNYRASDGTLAGFDIEIGKAICEEMKRECEWVVTDWDGIIPALMAKKFDAILSSMSMTAERRQRIDFSEAYYRDAVMFMAQKGSGITDTSPDALKGKTLGTQRSSSQGAYIEDLYKGSTLKFYNTVDEANLDLAAKRLDLVISFRIPLNDWITKSADGKCCELVGKPILDQKYFGDGAGIAVRKEDTALRDEFNRAIDAIVANGTYEKINAKYFPFSIWPGKQ